MGSQSIVPGAATPAVPASEPEWQRVVGIGLLALGLIALCGGFAVAATRRRQALARPEEAPPS